uniref:Ig-like domain-containing protein n=1 Tax=Oryzias sinensis TaxID=183150 RepID=A0A8C8DGB4_9TELE
MNVLVMVRGAVGANWPPRLCQSAPGQLWLQHPSAEVLEGSSVTLTCSSDANPAANYTWLKDNRTLLSEDEVHFSSIRSEHSGNYSCKSENKHGQSSWTPLLLDVQCKCRLWLRDLGFL